MHGNRPSIRLESPLPAALPAGSAVALYCSGTASVAGEPIRALELGVGGDRHDVRARAMPRFDAPCRRSGFWGVVPVRVPDGLGGPDALRVGARVIAADGTLGEENLGEIPVADPEPPLALPGPAPAGLIAVCMATFDPDPRLLEGQLDSIRAQTEGRWICVISDDYSNPERYAELTALVGDDERFLVSRCEERIGFYRNFERALRLAPAEAELIALSDQDDIWHPDKLAVLRASLGAATLVYSDLRLVDAEGRLLRETLWQGRRNNFTSLASMLVANTVTGASALFRREVAELALPFPDSPGIEFHDHWIALVALACGELSYVNRPLYDYVQHESAILGKVAGELARPRRSRLRPPRVREWRAAYFLGVIPGQVRARTLLLRCADRLTPATRRTLDRYLTIDRSAVSFAWFLLRPVRSLFGRTETLGGEWELVPGILWRWIAGVAAHPRWPERLALDTRFPDPPHFEQKRLRRWRSRVWKTR
jgi:glycosyltransferase involved in cell wall biosynthesis